MATFTVNITADVVDGNLSQLSLREAVAQANATVAPDIINFASALEGQSIVLTGGELLISRDLAIDGDVNNDGTEVTVDGGFNSRLLNIADATAASLTDLTLTNGRSGTYGEFGEGKPGGAVFVDGGSLTMTGSTIRGSESGNYEDGGDGGAIFANYGSRVTISNSSIADNVANGGGGGVAAARAELVIRDSLIADNFCTTTTWSRTAPRAAPRGTSSRTSPASSTTSTWPGSTPT